MIKKPWKIRDDSLELKQRKRRFVTLETNSKLHSSRESIKRSEIWMINYYWTVLFPSIWTFYVAIDEMRKLTVFNSNLIIFKMPMMITWGESDFERALLKSDVGESVAITFEKLMLLSWARGFFFVYGSLLKHAWTCVAVCGIQIKMLEIFTPQEKCVLLLMA